VSITPKTAEKMVELLVDRTLNDHYGQREKGSERPGVKCPDPDDCRHVESGSLAVARLIEANITIGKKRARLDIPDDPEVVKIMAERLRNFAGRAKLAGAAFCRVADVAVAWASRSPLHRLAEAGLELDDE
jgi:hypothetical protein